MRFHATEEIPFPRELVHRALRDHLPRVCAYLPPIRTIERISREERAGAVVQVHRWEADPDALPAPLRPLLGDRRLQWEEHGRWEDDAVFHWEQRVPALPSAFVARGRTELVDEGADTVVRLDAELVLHLDRLPMLPQALRERGAPWLEQWAFELLRPRFRELNEATARFVEAEWG